MSNREAALEAAVKHAIHLLESRSEGRLDPPGARIGLARTFLKDAIAGGTKSLDAYIEVAVREAVAAK